MSELRIQYPEIEPFDTGRLRVSPVHELRERDGHELYGHELYYEQCGNPEGQPVVFLHDGPGAGLSRTIDASSTLLRRFFDPAAYRVILFDQRGSGKSTPHASLEQERPSCNGFA